MIEMIKQPWPWWAGGIIIGLTVPALLILGNRHFGLSANFRHICAACIPADIPFFNYDWKKEVWNFYFVGGTVLGAFIASYFLSSHEAIKVAPALTIKLNQYGINDFSNLVPGQIISWQSLLTIRGFIIMVLGGFLIGFGTRYAGGCTSGHSIMGLSDLAMAIACCYLLFYGWGFYYGQFNFTFYIVTLNFLLMSTAIKEQELRDKNTDFEVRSLHTGCVNASDIHHHPWWYNLKYALVGIFFGIAFVKSEIISWFRIQEMFTLQSFHMYGVIGTGVMIGMISLQLIKRFGIKTIHDEEIQFHDKKFNKGQIYGGLIFGLGWAMTGACPGPMFAQLGAGTSASIIMILCATAGTWVYGKVREKLPH